MASLRRMKTVIQSPVDPGFMQNPYPFYDTARAEGDLVYWEDYKKTAAVSHRAVQALLKDRRFGREVPNELHRPGPDHLSPWLKVEAHSLLEAESPRHTRLRALVMRAFTSRAIAALEPSIHDLSHALIDDFPDTPFDLLDAFCTQIPVITICRLLGVPAEMSPNLLRWSHAMVAMYQASRTRETEDAAAMAAQDFTAFLGDYIEQRRTDPQDDLITRLIAAEEDGEKLSRDELVATCVLLLNAGHEATVHSLGNGVKTVLQLGLGAQIFAPDQIDGTVEEILRYDPPLHMFTRYAYEDVEIFDHSFKRGDEVALLLGAANRDAAVWKDPHRFDPTRHIVTNTSFGGGLHFCVGAPLARLEMRIALIALFRRWPTLHLSEAPEYSNTYHFHGLTRLMVQV
ncbi:Biotin biosynthesis cytochrome P450 [Ruegeria meonggei]|uniref:Biotin biosynthesis cytochrome P450 n=2 Tax=Ruegeria meonggei TaxID=1446476 RepID=A0A1X7A4C5_9RHOB|nr:Biotin biosynthesis cytochrome P450 [Ruegeria meonggei]